MPFPQAPETFTVYNYGSYTAYINYFDFDVPSGITYQADLTNFGGSGSFTDTTTRTYNTAQYRSHTAPVNATYSRHTGTTLTVSSTDRILPSWLVSGNGYFSNQRVTSVINGIRLTTSAPPTVTPTVGGVITFSTSSIRLRVNSTTGISAGDIAEGNGYNGQSVVSVIDSNWLSMSAHPSTNPVYNGNIRFYQTSNLSEIPPNSSTTFIADYTNVSSNLTTYYPLIDIHATINGVAGYERVRNTVIVSNAPVVGDPGVFYAGDAGGGGGGDSTSSCSDASASGCGGGGCFTANTKITMADGSKKEISKIQAGDMVREAFTERALKVLAVKIRDHDTSKYIFSTDENEPFITEEHPFYDIQGNLCAISDLCYYQAPWLGKPRVVEVSKKIKIDKTIPVYNLILETGNSHYANDLPVNNIVGNGGLYVLVHKNFLEKELYESYVYNPGNYEMPKWFQSVLYKIIVMWTSYILTHNNWLSVTMARFASWLVRHRPTIENTLNKWFKSKTRKFIKEKILRIK